jgi:mycothiol synthase
MRYSRCGHRPASVSRVAVHPDRLWLDGPDVDRWCEIYSAGRTLDSGSRGDAASLASLIRATRAPHTEYFGARRDEQLIGAASVSASTTTQAFARIYVDVASRRSGAGRALADQVLGWARGRRFQSVTATVGAGSEGEYFASALGACVVLRLVTVVRDLHEEVIPVPAPAGLRLLRWRNRAPDDLLDSCALLHRTVGDAPDARLQMDAAARTSTWVRQWEHERTANGDELWVCAAVDDATAELVGFTEVQVPATGDAQQHDTAVLPKWRGRGVATWLKAEMLAWLLREKPRLETLASTINQGNTPMLRVCSALGFREARRRHLVAIDL